MYPQMTRIGICKDCTFFWPDYPGLVEGGGPFRPCISAKRQGDLQNGNLGLVHVAWVTGVRIPKKARLTDVVHPDYGCICWERRKPEDANALP